MAIDTGVIFLDVLNNAERISDHCSISLHGSLVQRAGWTTTPPHAEKI